MAAALFIYQLIQRQTEKVVAALLAADPLSQYPLAYPSLLPVPPSGPLEGFT